MQVHERATMPKDRDRKPCAGEPRRAGEHHQWTRAALSDPVPGDQSRQNEDGPNEPVEHTFGEATVL